VEDVICGIWCKRYDEAAETGLEGTALPSHQCTCNVCCLDIETIKKTAVEAALAKADEARLTAGSAAEGGGKLTHEESKNNTPDQQLSEAPRKSSLLVNQQEH